MVSPWITVLHVVGVVLWVGGLIAVLSLLTVLPRVEAAGRDAVVGIGRKVALLMDLGATVAIATGLYRALAVTPNEFTRGGWLHIKLTAVVIGVLAVHGMARARLGKARRGQVASVPAFLWVLLAVGAAAAIALGANPELMRG